MSSGRHRPSSSSTVPSHERDGYQSKGVQGVDNESPESTTGREHRSGARRPRSASPLMPRTILLDMDGTLIGRITPQVCEYEVVSMLQKRKVRQVRADIVQHLRMGVARPHLLAFLTRVKEAVPRTEFFVYTASDDSWAKFIVPCIEEAIGFKFSRPIFTRRHCRPCNGDYKKSIAAVAPHILRRLRPSYAGLIGARAEDIVRDAMLIDNNPAVMRPDEEDRLVRCSTYNYAHFRDVLAKVEPGVLHARHARLVPLLAAFGLLPARTSAADVRGIEHFLAMYYDCLADCARAALGDVAQSRRDRTWAILGDLLSAPAPDRVSPAFVAHLNRALR